MIIKKPPLPGGTMVAAALSFRTMRWLINPCARVRPVAASTRRPCFQAVPSALTLTEKSSLPASPISARPLKPVWYIRLAVCPGAALFSFS